MQRRRSAWREPAREIVAGSEIIGEEATRRVAAIDPIDYGRARVITLKGAFVATELDKTEWARREDYDANAY